MYKRILIVSTIIIMILAMIDFGLSDKKEFTPTSNPSPPKEWVKFVPFTGKFTVYLPKTPKYAVDIVNVPNTDIQRWYEMYVSEEINGTVYLLNLISYGPDYPITDAKNILHNVVNEIVARNLNNRLTKLEDGKFQNQPAIFFQIENEPAEIKGVAFLDEKTVYQLTYTALSENFEEQEYDEFIHSFQLSQT